MVSKEDLDRQIQETERKLQELKEKETNPLKGFEANGLKPEGGDIHGMPNIKRAAIVTTPEGNQRGIICLWDDDHVTTILGSETGAGSAYTTSKPEGDKVFYMSCAWAANLGHKIKPIPVD